MNTVEFFNIVLPTQGYRCIAKPQEYGFAQHVLNSNIEASKRAYWLDHSMGDTVYFACGSLKEPFILGKNAVGVEKKFKRTRENIAFIKSFWLDIDCGEGKPYIDQPTALQSLVKFLTSTKLPTPLIINSGYGLHVYFPLEEDVSPDTWKKVAKLLAVVAEHYQLKVDTTRTQDISSILRPVGCYNKKDPASPKLVRPIPTQWRYTNLIEMASLLAKQIKDNRLHVAPDRVAPVSNSLNQSLIGGIYGDNTLSAQLIAEGCAAVRKMRDTQGNIQEPLWYASIGILRYTVDGEDIIQEWSSGHPGYSYEQTDSKIMQHVAAGARPTTCDYIRSATEASLLCATCPHYGNITSPIQLGRPVAPEAPAILAAIPVTETAELVDLFIPRDIGVFELTQTGVLYKDSFEPGNKVELESKVLLLNYPLIVKTTAEDEYRGGILEIQCRHPNKKLHSFFIDKAVLAEKAAFNKEMLRNHIVISTGKVDLMRDYVISYLQELDQTAELEVMYNTMGWKSDELFILGAKSLKKGLPIKTDGVDIHLENNFCKHVTNVGTVQNWVQNTEFLKQPGLEKHLFSLLWGFGAPLMRFTGFPGAFVNIVGQSNAGKTTMLTWICSIYGDYNELKAQKNDTYNSLMNRLGVLGSLPFVIDELTNIDYKDVSDLIHNITQGREKGRLTKASMAMTTRTWSTIAIGSSNSSMTDKLMVAKDDPEAERLRLIEYWLPRISGFESKATQIHELLSTNYGGVGEIYIKYLVDNSAVITNTLKHVKKTFIEQSGAVGKERFWVAAISAAITGGLIARSIGLVTFDPKVMIATGVSIVRAMRGELDVNHVDYTATLGRYLNEKTQNTMFLKYSAQGVPEAAYEPARELYVRIEHIAGGKKIFADKRNITEWLQKHHVSSSEFVKELKEVDVLKDFRGKKVLGAGWANNPNNAAVQVIEFFLPDDLALASTLNPAKLGLTLVKI